MTPVRAGKRRQRSCMPVLPEHRDDGLRIEVEPVADDLTAIVDPRGAAETAAEIVHHAVFPQERAGFRGAGERARADDLSAVVYGRRMAPRAPERAEVDRNRLSRQRRDHDERRDRAERDGDAKALQ